ncbi:MAG: T9SS C-terminal target domain-containing protein, partial [Saprospiraceae bacterium]
MNVRIYCLLLLLVTVASSVMAQTTVNITDASLQGNQTYNWTKNNVYLLDGLVFLEEGGVLNIEAGTVIKFTPRADVGNPSALIIARGAKIYANGTAQEPIIFTAQADDVNNPTDLGPNDNALWGGLIILGRGITQKNGNAEVSIEGIPATETRGLYGGNNNADDSGVVRYVSIRHGGRLLVSGSEINGLTLGGVGSKTILEYIEIYANSDDGIEFFGGAPNLKHAVVAFAEDDSFDWDEVYTGQGQFWFSIQRPDIADAGGELDGTTPDDLTPFSNPTVYNWTHIGSGIGAAAANPIGWLFRAGTAGTVANSIVTGQKGKVIEVQDKNTGTNDAYEKLKNGSLKILNNVFFGNGSNAAIDATSTGIIRVTSGQPTQDETTPTTLINHLTTNQTSLMDPGIQSISRTANAQLDPRPSGTGSAYNTPLAAVPNDGFFETVNFKGAFSAAANELWIAGWTALAKNGHLRNLDAPATTTVNVVDSTLIGGRKYFWTKDKTYLLDGLVFLEEGSELYIEAGTVIKFTPRADVGNPSALIITRGAKIFAQGTEEEPIIFTAQADDVNNPTDLGPNDNALWGGLIILGRGITQKNGNAEVSIEGIPATETRGLYGGNNNDDNSGILRYISIRHGGRLLVSGSEINGLTLGGVGSGTIMEYIEIYANSDDGIEFFGGAPNLKYAAVA